MIDKRTFPYKPLRIALIGSGSIARIHGRLIVDRPEAELVGIADTDLARAKALTVELKAGQAWRDAKAMIDEVKPHVVHVLSPPQYHAKLSIMAMKRGCHVLVEKPMALKKADAKKMIATAISATTHHTKEMPNIRCFCYV